MTQLLRVRTTLAYGAGGPGLGTHYFRPSVAGGSSANASAALAGVRAFWLALAAQMSNTLACLPQGSVDLVDDTDGALVGGFSVAPPALVAGTAAVPVLPVFSSLVIEYGTSGIVSGRRLRGRTYVGPLGAAASTSTGTPTTAAGTAAVAAIAALTAVADPVFVIWSRPRLARAATAKLPALSARVGSNSTVTGGQAWSSFGSLRSRRD